LRARLDTIRAHVPVVTGGEVPALGAACDALARAFRAETCGEPA
jgi:hypothetical protein